MPIDDVKTDLWNSFAAWCPRAWTGSCTGPRGPTTCRPYQVGADADLDRHPGQRRRSRCSAPGRGSICSSTAAAASAAGRAASDWRVAMELDRAAIGRCARPVGHRRGVGRVRGAAGDRRRRHHRAGAGDGASRRWALAATWCSMWRSASSLAIIIPTGSMSARAHYKRGAVDIDMLQAVGAVRRWRHA